MPHTPGPWYLDPCDYGIVRSGILNGSGPNHTPGGGVQICAVNECMSALTDGRANAALIAAAPEMLEVLKATHPNWKTHSCRTCELIRKVEKSSSKDSAHGLGM